MVLWVRQSSPLTVQVKHDHTWLGCSWLPFLVDLVIINTVNLHRKYEDREFESYEN